MWHELFQTAHVRLRYGYITTLVASDFARLSRVEVILSALTLQKLAGLGDLDPLGDCLGGLLFHIGLLNLFVQ